ncbi:MAG: HDIG domain-containing metalloprotein [Myxococcota bacterium]
MTVQVSTTIDEGRAAEAALAWAAQVAEGTARLDEPPPMPGVEPMRALPMAVVRKHMDAVLVGKDVVDGLEALHATRVLDAWLPEVAAMVGFGDGEWRHKDVWRHTKLVCSQIIPRLELRWGALLHDIGKPRTRSMDRDGRVHFHGHAEVGASMFRKRVAKRLAFEEPLRERVHFLILHHLRPSQYDGSWTDSAVRRFYKHMGEGLEDLLLLSRADITTKRPERRKRLVRRITELQARIRELQAADAKVPPLPKGLGNLLMTHFGIPPSKKLGDIRKQLEAEVEAGELEGGRDPEYYLAHIEQHRDRYL